MNEMIRVCLLLEACICLRVRLACCAFFVITFDSALESWKQGVIEKTLFSTSENVP